MTSIDIIKDLEPYMFSLDVMNKLLKDKTDGSVGGLVSSPQKVKVIKSNRKNDKVKGEIKSTETENNNDSALKDNSTCNVSLWKPSEQDKIFWSFYYIYKGDHDYIESKKHSFRIERDMKIDAVEKIKLKSDKVKQFGFKMYDLENDLINTKRITHKGLYALCIAYNISVIYVKNRTYMDITIDNSYKGIIITKDGDSGCQKCINLSDEISKIRNSYYLINNPNKPIKAISAYTLTDIINIAQLFDINLYNEKGKKKVKKMLYEEITCNL